MLKIIGCGWASLSLNGNEVCKCGYITDVPNDFLEGFITLLGSKNSNGVVITAHLEPGDFFLVLSRGFDRINNYYEIDTTEGFERVSLPSLNYINLAEELISDIESDLGNWARFQLGSLQESPKLFIKNKKKILKNLKILKQIIKTETQTKKKEIAIK